MSFRAGPNSSDAPEDKSTFVQTRVSVSFPLCARWEEPEHQPALIGHPGKGSCHRLAGGALPQAGWGEREKSEKSEENQQNGGNRDHHHPGPDRRKISKHSRSIFFVGVAVGGGGSRHRASDEQ